jgi:hypothetical protein
MKPLVMGVNCLYTEASPVIPALKNVTKLKPFLTDLNGVRNSEQNIIHQRASFSEALRRNLMC